MRKRFMKSILSLPSIYILSASLVFQGSRLAVFADETQTAPDSLPRAEALPDAELAGASSIEDGSVYVFYSQVGDGMVLDIAGASYASSGNLQIYQSNGTNAQKFIAEKNDDGTFCFYSCCAGYAIDVQAGGCGTYRLSAVFCESDSTFCKDYP